MILLQLFWEYFKTGLFAVGGGLATLPFLQEISAKTGWFTLSELTDMIAISESTPGPIGVNCATYVGFKTAGLVGAIVAPLGLIVPSITVILIIAAILDKFRKNRVVDSAFYGLRPASTALIASAGISVAILTFWNSGAESILGYLNWKCLVLALLILYFTRWCKKTKKLHPIFFILGAAVCGIVFGL